MKIRGGIPLFLFEAKSVLSAIPEYNLSLNKILLKSIQPFYLGAGFYSENPKTAES